MKYLLILLLSGCATYTPVDVYVSVQVGDNYDDVVNLLGIPSYKKCYTSVRSQTCTIGYRNLFYYKFDSEGVLTSTYL